MNPWALSDRPLDAGTFNQTQPLYHGAYTTIKRHRSIYVYVEELDDDELELGTTAALRSAGRETERPGQRVRAPATAATVRNAIKMTSSIFFLGLKHTLCI